MDCTASFLSYEQTGYFSKIVLDYVKQDPALQPFYRHPLSPEGIKDAIEARKNFPTNRKLLVTVLQKQYAELPAGSAVAQNIALLQNENTFTICTAHQPNIFTGPLYFIYKILHAVRLAATLKAWFPENDFVPVYYMGSEDADLEELGHIYVNEEKYEWKTAQTGAVGRMKVDKALVQLLGLISGQLAVYPYGDEIISLMKSCYAEGITIEAATFHLVNALFKDFGLVVILPDNAALKASFAPVIEKELTREFSHGAVQETIARYPAGYRVQASGREMNMFYLKDDKRERIEMQNGVWKVRNTDLQFTKDEMLAELRQYPGGLVPT